MDGVGAISASTMRVRAGLKHALVWGPALVALLAVAPAQANPRNGRVVGGQATISTPDTSTTRIEQFTSHAIIDWSSFNISQGESTVFVQPSSSAVALNRIFDQNPTTIAGSLSANGRIILINANGMVFENGASVSAAGLIATTADIGNDDFMSGNYRFEIPGATHAQIENRGLITAEQGGVVAFVAPSVRNSGVIEARLGRVELAAGKTFVVDLYGDGLLSFPVSAEIAEQINGPDGSPLSSLVEAGGKIEAGSVRLTARAARGLIDNVINVDGEIVASTVQAGNGSTMLTGNAPAGFGSYGGAIVVDGGDNNVAVSGSLRASGSAGGSISIAGRDVATSGEIAAEGLNGSGGAITLAAQNFAAVGGSVSANGAAGGSVNVTAGNILTSGSISANGTNGGGGSITLTAADRQIATSSTRATADGQSGGGSIALTGASGLFSSGRYSAASGAGSGGGVRIHGADIKLIDAAFDVSGATGGGTIAAGFSGSGASRTIDADSILVSPTSTFTADATGSGNGGSVIFWSRLASDFMGSMSARGGAAGGNGGVLEVSSQGDIGFWGLGDASAAAGQAGILSLDPKNLIVSSTGGPMPNYELIDPGSGSSTFGGNVVTLANGNTVVTSTGDDTVASNSGAVFVYNTTTGGLISMITGSRTDDAVGSGGVTALASGNFVFSSANWDNGAAAANAGAVTFGNGVTGVSGTVSAANSLVGGAANMNVGSQVFALSNGNYVVASPNWDNGAITNVGAVTWGNGTSGTTGAVSAANSLIGSQSNDQAGSGGVTVLSNGNYVVRSLLWNNGGTTDAGAVTWGNGLGGTNGVISAANSLVGSSSNDQIGSSGVTALANGNFVVASSLWNNGAASDAGAVTWGNGAGGTVGTLSAANSLVGTAANNNVGSGGVVALSNGNYVAVSPNWDNGGTSNAGAVTWGNGATGTSGNVGAGNSTIGSASNDQIGSGGVYALSNGNYVIASPLWNNGGTSDAGAATWGNGLGGTIGAVSAANSLVGTAANNNVGSSGIVALTNGNYVVVSPNWDNGGTSNAGAVTWGNGAAGTAGNVALGNSTIGSASNDQVGSGGVFALTNGNYVIASPLWNNGGTSDAGAATWRSGAGASAGPVTAANSLVGTRTNDNIGSGGVRALTNGHYVVASPNWDSGAFLTSNQGAVTWGNGTIGTVGSVTAGISLTGANSGDQAGSGGVIALASGDYVVSSPSVNQSFFTADVGAVTLLSGGGTSTGTITSANSLLGLNSGAQLSATGTGANGEIIARSTASGFVLVGLTNPSQISFARAQGQTLTVNPAFLTRTLNTGTAVSLQASNDLTVSSDILANNPSGNGGALTLQAGRSVLINANITTDNGNLTVVANELLANGVIDAQRDPGNAVLSMGAGVSINAGSGAVRLTIASGAGKSQSASGDLTLRSISAGTIIAENLGPSNGNVVIASGSLNATGGGTALVLASQGGNFINNAGAGALSAPGGRYLVYSQNPAANALGGLSASPYYNTPYNAANPGAVAASGSRFAYTLAPVLTVTPNNASRVYGDPNPAFTYSVSGLMGGDTLAGAVQGAPLLSSAASPASTVAGGPYAIDAAAGTLSSDYNYGFAFAPGQLSITPAQLLYLANAASREYGDPNVLSGVLSGLRNGETAADVATGTMVFTSLADNLSNVGTYGVLGSGLTVTSGNYSATILQDPFNATALSVVPAQLYYRADAVSRAYGEDNPDLDGILAGLRNGDDLDDIGEGDLVWTTTATVTSPVGQYAVTGSGVLVTNPNYAVTVLQDPGNATALTIAAAQLFYVADDQNREYGDPNPDLTGEVEGLVNGDTLEAVVSGTLTFTTAVTATTNVGLYAIDGSGLTVINPNYSLTILQDPGNATAFEITPAQLSYLADQATRIYGDANPLFTGTVLGLRNGESLEDVTDGTLLFSTPATETSNVGEYAIDGSGLTVTSGNYEAVIVQDSNNETALTIDPAQLTYVANLASKIYGHPDPVFTGTVAGLKNGEALEDVTDGVLAWVPDTTVDGDVGVYGVFGEGLTVTSGNYEVEILQAPENEFVYTINQAQLVYLADPRTRYYGFVGAPYTGQVLGLAPWHQLDDAVDGDLEFTSPATQTSPAGLYPIWGGGLTIDDTNYIATILQDPSNATALTILPVPVTTEQAQGESSGAAETKVDQEQNSMTSRAAELRIACVEPVSIDVEDGRNDGLAGQLYILGAPEMQTPPACAAQDQAR